MSSHPATRTTAQKIYAPGNQAVRSPTPSIIITVTVPTRVRVILEDIERLRKALITQQIMIDDSDVLNALEVVNQALVQALNAGQIAQGILDHIASLEFTR